MTLRPLADRVAVRRLERDEKTPGGIIIPQTAADDRKATACVVVAVGPGRLPTRTKTRRSTSGSACSKRPARSAPRRSTACSA